MQKTPQADRKPRQATSANNAKASSPNNAKASKLQKGKGGAPQNNKGKQQGGPGFAQRVASFLRIVFVFLLRVLFHGGACAGFGYSLYYDQMYVYNAMGSDRSRNFGGFNGKLKFLTIWNLILQALYFGICLVNDIVGSNEPNPKKKPFVRRLKDVLLASLAFPLAMFVGITFWALYAIDRELVFPKILDEFFPTWLNHVMHTNIMVFTILEVVTSFRLYPKRSTGLKILVSFMALYLAWTHVIYYMTGDWVYPVCDVLNWWQRLIFFGAMIMFCVLLYFVGELFNNKVWDKEVKQFQPSQKKGKKKN